MDAKCCPSTLPQVFDKCWNSIDNRIIASNFVVSRPPRSSHLNLVDFCFWSYLKSKVHTSNPLSLSGLIYAIKWEDLQIPPTMIHLSLLSTISRMQCVGTLKTCNSNNSLFFSLLVCYHWFFAMFFANIFYAANLRHACHVPTPFKVFPCSNYSVCKIKIRYCQSKISKFCHCKF